MPFTKGKSGSPGGKRKRLGLSRPVRASEGLKTWARLLDVRDGLVLERKKIAGKDGEVVEVDVVLDAKLYLDTCYKILNYTWGLPIQQADSVEERIKSLERRLRELTVIKGSNGFHGHDYAS